MPEDSPIVIDVLANDTDANIGDQLSVTAVNITGTLGLVTNNGGDVTYNPNGQFEFLQAGDETFDSFSYTVSDGHGGTTTADVNVTVRGVNDAPVAVAQMGMGDEGNETVPSAPIMGNLLMGASDVDNDDALLTVTEVDTVAVVAGGITIVGTFGSLMVNPDGSYTFTMDDAAVDGLNLLDELSQTFSFTISDNEPEGAKTTTSTLEITVKGTNDAPVAVAQMGMGDEGNETVPSAPIMGNLLMGASDVDNDDALLTVTEVDTVAVVAGGITIVGTFGSLMVNPDGSYTFTMDDAAVDGLNLLDELSQTFSFTISDNEPEGAKTATETLTITVKGTNDAPVAVAQMGMGDEGNETVPSAPIMGNLLMGASDVGNDDALLTVTEVDTVAVVAGGITIVGTFGSLMVNPDGSYTFTMDDAAVDGLNLLDELSQTFSFTISDNEPEGAKTTTSTLEITVKGTNDAPVAVAQMGMGDEGNETVPSAPIMGNLLMGASDVGNDDALLTVTEVDTVAVVAGGITIVGTFGSLMVNPDGSYTFTMDDAAVDGLNLLDELSQTFSFTISDNEPEGAKTTTSTLEITVKGTNDAPVAVAQMGMGDEGNETVPSAPIMGNLLMGASDVDNDDALLTVTEVDTVAVVAGGITIVGTFGSLMVNPDGSYTFTMDDAAVDGLNLLDELSQTFSFTISDNEPEGAKTATETLTITVKGTNDAPVAVAQMGMGDEGNETVPSAPIMGNLLMGASDVGNDDALLTVTEVDTVAVVAGGITIVGTFGSLMVNPDGSYTFTMDDAAVDGLNLLDELSQTFSFTISDNEPEGAKTATETLTITVKGTNDAPVAVAQMGMGDEGNETVPSAPIMGNLLMGASDVDNDDALLTVTEVDTVAVVAGGITIVGTFGSLMVNPDGSYTFTMDDAAVDGLNLLDELSQTFSFTISDNEPEGAKTATETLTITVKGTNDAPVAVAQMGMGDEGNETVPSAPIMGNLLMGASDVDNDDALLTVTEVDTVAVVAGGITIVGTFGSLMVNPDGSYTFTMDDAAVDGLNLLDELSQTFSFTISDNEPEGAKTATETLTITVKGTNDAPVANTDVAMTTENASVTVDVLADDEDVDSTTFSLDSATIGSTTGLSVSPAAAGAAAIVGNQLFFDPGTAFDELDPGDEATVVVNYTMSDDSGAESSSTATITVKGENDDPVAVSDTMATTDEDTPVSVDVLANDTDVDGDDNPTNFTLVSVMVASTMGLTVSSAAAGTATVQGNQLKFEPGTDFDELDGGDTATVVVNYTMADDSGAMSSSMATITVNGKNDPPKAMPDTASTDSDKMVTVDVLLNDTDIDGDDNPMNFSLDNVQIVSTTGLPGSPGPAGTATIVNNQLKFDPSEAFDALRGSDTATVVVEYTMSDDSGAPASSMATITVNADNTPPDAKDDEAITESGKRVNIDVLANDMDADDDALFIDSFDARSARGARITERADGRLRYDPDDVRELDRLDDDEFRDDTFTYTVSDGNGGFDTATVKVTVVGDFDDFF